MTTKDQLLQMQTVFQAWAKGNRGTVHIAADAYHAVYLLTTAPGATKLILLCHGEKKRGEFEESGLVDRIFWAVLSRGRGMKVEPGASLVEGVAGGKPMLDLTEEVRETIRRLSFDADTTEVTPDYKGWEPFPIEGYLTDAQRLEFTIGVQLPDASVARDAEEPDVETA